MYKPSKVTLAANSVDIMNAIRAANNYDYQNRIPVVTQETIRETGQAIMEYEATKNAFINTLVNRIARVIITSKMYENPLKPFKKGIMEYGDTVEELFVNIAKAQPFNQSLAEEKWMQRVIPDVAAAYHKLNSQLFYKVTVSDKELMQAFLNANGVTDLLARIVDSLYSGSEFDEFLSMKNLINESANNGNFYTVTVPTPSAANAKDLVTTIKAYSNSLEFMSGKYNKYGLLTFTKKANQVLIIDTKLDAMIDVEVLASAFNMNKAEFMGRRVLIDNFGGLTGAVAALVDEDYFMVFDNMIQFTENYNGEGLYWNYWYHVWKTYSTSPFVNAILFTTDANTITSVSVTPKTATLTPGASQQFTAEVVTTGYPLKGVVWSCETDASAIAPDGYFTAPDNATSGSTYKITATSMVDSTKSDTATVTIA